MSAKDVAQWLSLHLFILQCSLTSGRIENDHCSMLTLCFLCGYDGDRAQDLTHGPSTQRLNRFYFFATRSLFPKLSLNLLSSYHGFWSSWDGVGLCHQPDSILSLLRSDVFFLFSLKFLLYLA